MKEGLKNLIGGIFVIVFISVIIIIIISFTTALTVGLWDLLIWLLKADWRTTDFVVPKWAAIIFIVSYLINQIMGKLWDYLD